MTEMYDGQLELEYTCVSCHRNVYPRRLASGYCSDCLIGDMTPEELAAEYAEHEAWKDDYAARHIRDYACDVLNGKRTLKDAASACYVDLGDMEDAVDDLRHEREEDDRYWREYAQDVADLRTIRNAAHIHRALRRGAAYRQKRAWMAADAASLREIRRGVREVNRLFAAFCEALPVKETAYATALLHELDRVTI